jgi:hypothetical protein
VAGVNLVSADAQAKCGCVIKWKSCTRKASRRAGAAKSRRMLGECRASRGATSLLEGVGGFHDARAC